LCRDEANAAAFIPASWRTEDMAGSSAKIVRTAFETLRSI
jgi:hypothetical protein